MTDCSNNSLPSIPFVLHNCVVNLRFADYEFHTTMVLHSSSSGRLLACANIFHRRSQHDSERKLTALVVEGNYIVCRAFCSLNKLPVDEKRLGNVEQLKGYLSINVFDGPLAVVVYHNRVCVHDLSNEDTFNQPLVLTVKSDIGYVHCVAFQHNIAEHSSTQLKSYIFMRFRGSVSSSREWIVLDCTNIYSMREQSDSIIEGELMYDSGDNSSLLSQRHRSVCLPNDRPVSSIVVQEGFPGLEVSGTEVVNIAYATIIGGSRYSSNIRHTAVAGAQRRRSKSLLAVTLCTSGLLSCSENGQFTFKRALPLAGVTGHDYLYEIELRTTDSATSPLLLLQYRHTLLVLDLMNEGTVLKEFSNIGAYACAPLFHPLECHLLIVPASEQATRKLTFLSHGKTYNGSTDGLLDSAVVEPAAAAPSNGGEASLQNYFVYELPTSPSNTTLRVNRNGIGVRAGAGAGAPSVCRSMDPHGLWREDSKLSINAEEYNSVQWQRRLAPQQHRAGSPEAPPAESTRTSGNTPNAFATPCTATASESAVGKKRAAPSDLSTAGPAGATNNEDVPAEVFPLNNSYSSKIFESQENNATSSNQNDRHELLRNLGAHLEGLQHEVRTYSAFLRYKLAAADYLRSVLINRSLSADTNPPDHGTHCTASGSLSSHQPCVSTGPECANNPYLKRLREAEAGYLVPVTSRSENSTAAQLSVTAQNLLSMSHDPWCKDVYSSLETLERSPAACAIILHSLHFIPQQPGRHCVEVCAFISNIHLTSAVYDMHLSAYMDNCNRTAGDRKGSVNVSCMSAKVDVLQPDKQCCVRALVHLPANTFTATQSAEVVLRISVHWRDRVGLAEGHADCSVGRSLSTGEVHLCMADLFSHSTRVNKSIAPEYGKYCCGYVSAVGGTHRTAQRGPPSLPASSAHRKDVKDRTDRPPSIPVYSYLPRLFVTLCSPLVSQLRAIQALNPYQVSPRQVAHELRSFLQTARASIFSARIIQEHVTRQLTEQQRPAWEYTTSLLTVADSASKASTTSTSRSTNVAVVLRFLPITTGDVKDPPVSMDSAELGRLAESEVRVPVALCASFLAASAYTSLGDALLFLRKVLPNEVEIESRTIGACPADTARAAAEFLLDELKLLAVGLRLKAEQRGASTADAELVQVCSNLRVPTSIARRILRSHIRADLAIASL